MTEADNNLNNPKTVLNGLAASLSTGARVFGSPVEQGGVIWIFTDKDGVETPLRLSDEAMEAMMGIWQSLRGGAA